MTQLPAVVIAPAAATAVSSPYYGSSNPPKYVPGAYYPPAGFNGVSGAFTATATRVYYVPFSIYYAHTFQGVQCFNGGAGNNGALIRIMMFNDDIGGGPGTLAKDFGQITLTGASAARTLSSTWAATPGIYWGAIWMQLGASMFGMAPYTVGTSVGTVMGPTMIDMMGTLNAATTFFNGSGTLTAAHYVDTTYGAAPATAVAPTSSLEILIASTPANIPAFMLKA